MVFQTKKLKCEICSFHIIDTDLYTKNSIPQYALNDSTTTKKKTHIVSTSLKILLNTECSPMIFNYSHKQNRSY